MAHGYPNGKYRGGNKDRSKKDSGIGKNDQHGNCETHSRRPKSSGSKQGGKHN